MKPTISVKPFASRQALEAEVLTVIVQCAYRDGIKILGELTGFNLRLAQAIAACILLPEDDRTKQDDMFSAPPSPLCERFLALVSRWGQQAHWKVEFPDCVKWWQEIGIEEKYHGREEDLKLLLLSWDAWLEVKWNNPQHNGFPKVWKNSLQNFMKRDRKWESERERSSSGNYRSMEKCRAEARLSGVGRHETLEEFEARVREIAKYRGLL